MLKTQILLLFLLFSTELLWAQAASDFDGIDDRATVYHHNDFNLSTDDFTIEAIVRDVALEQSMLTIISKRDLSTNGFALMLNTKKGSKLIAEIGKDKYEVSTSVFEDKGCHSVGLRRSKDKVTLFIDDKAYSFSGKVRDINTTENLLIGDDGSNTHNPFNGYIEEVRFWNIARSDGQVFDWRNKCIEPSTSGLLALWDIEETSGQFFHDIASIQHHAYLGSDFSNDNQDPLWSSNECLETCCDGRAKFTVSTPNPIAAQWVNFNNISINAATYEWSVDNQVVSTNQHLQYSFGMGVSIVRLRINSERDCYSYYSMAIEVTNAPELCQQPSQTISDCSPEDLNNPNTPLLIRDNWGNCFIPESLVLPAPSSSRSNNPNYPPGQVCDCGHFRLFFKDVIDNRQEVNSTSGVLEGYGFNDPVNGAMRRTSLCRVYEDISFLLNTSLSSTEKVRIEVRQSGDASNALMDAGVLGLGGTYFIDIGNVFSHGEVAKTIIKGEDSYKDLQYYNSNFATIPHGTVRFRFNTNWNFDLSLSPPLATSSQRDFYSVALHEALHSLGFVSLISSSGNSVLAGNGTPFLYSMYDSYLMNSTSGNPLISNTATSTGGYTCTNTSPNLGTISACPTFNGNYTNNSNHPTYFDLSAGFEPGSSLSHFNCSAPFSNSYIMNKAYTPNRRLNIAEVEALCDIGYTTSGTYGQNISPTNNTLATYNNSCSHPCQVIGTNDVLIPGTTTPYRVCRSGTSCLTPGEITITDILANDNGTGNLPTGYDCLTIHSGGGQFTTTTTTGFTYQPNPAYGGWATLSYIPTCTSGGSTIRGSRAYVLIFVDFSPDPECQVYAPNDCNLICNGDFEGYNWQTLITNNSSLNDFTFDLVAHSGSNIRLCNGPTGKYITLRLTNASVHSPGFNSLIHPAGGIVLELAKPILANETIELYFDASGQSSSNNSTPDLRIFGSENRPCPYFFTAAPFQHNASSCGVPSTALSSCPSFVPYCIANRINILPPYATGSPVCPTNVNFQNYSVTYTHPASASPINYLVISKINSGSTSPVSYSTQFHLDNVELYKTNNLAIPMNITSSVLNPTPCVGTNTSITYDICFDAALGVLPTSINLSHDLFGSTTMNYGSGGDFDANGQKTLQLSDFTFDAGTNSYCISLTQELDITGSINQAEDILLNIDAGEMCFTSATVAQSLNQITPTQPLNSVTTLSISPSQTTANIGDVITYTVQMCNTSTAVPPNGDLTGVTLDILPQAGLTYNFTTPFLPPHTFDLATGVCSTFTFTATVTLDCISPAVEVAATSSCIPYSQQANPVSIGGGGSVDFPIEAENTAHTDPTIFTATAISNNDEIYSVGIFSNDINFTEGGSTNTLVKSHTCASLFSPFLVKYSSCGFEWAVEIPVCNLLDLKAGPDVEIGQNGDIYVAFSFLGSFTINGTTYTSQGDADIAIIKYDPTGMPIWVRTEGGNGNDLVSDLELHYNGTNTNIFITGTLDGVVPNSVTFGTTTINYGPQPCSGCTQLPGIMYTSSYTDNGTSLSFNWAKTINATNSIAGKLDIDPLGNVYVAGYTMSSFTFNSNTIGSTSTLTNQGSPSSATGDLDVFILKYNSTGAEIWAEVYGSDRLDIIIGVSEASPFGIDIECEGSSHLGLLLPSTGLSTSGGTQSYMTNFGTHLLRLNATNGSLIFAQPIANQSLAANNLAGNAIYFCNLDIDGSNYLINGSFLLENPNNSPIPATGFSSIDFYGNIVNYTSMSSYPAYDKYQGTFTASFNNSSGGLQWINTNTTITPLPPAIDRHATLVNLGIETDNAGNIYTPFYFRGTTTLNTNNLTGGINGNQDVVDGFISKIDGTTGNYLRQSVNNSSTNAQNDLTTTGNNNQILETSKITTTNNISTILYPNPTTGKVTLEIKSNLENNEVEQIIIYDVTGRKVQEINTKEEQKLFDINLDSQQSGVYFVELMINQELITKRVILMK